jgi:hypothetical protein
MFRFFSLRSSCSVLCCSSSRSRHLLLLFWLKTLAVVHQFYQRFLGPPSFEGRQPVQPATAYSSRSWFTDSRRRPFYRTFVANRGSIGEAESEWECYPDTVYRGIPRSPCDFLARWEWGIEGLPLSGAPSTIPSHAVRTALASEVSLLR